MSSQSSEDIAISVVVVLLLIGVVWFVYMQATTWGPQEKAKREEAARQAAIVAEAKKVEVANKAAPQAEAAKKRFSAEFHGEFFGGFQNNVRQIFILKDNMTGVEYLAVTGCGVSELRTETYIVKEGKNNVTKTRVVGE